MNTGKYCLALWGIDYTSAGLLFSAQAFPQVLHPQWGKVGIAIKYQVDQVNIYTQNRVYVP